MLIEIKAAPIPFIAASRIETIRLSAPSKFLLLAPPFSKQREQYQHLWYFFNSDEAWFHLDGYINSQNYRIWSSENPYMFCETGLHPLKIGTWCTVSRCRIVSQIFFESIIKQFIALLEWARLFQQDSTKPHTSRDTMAFLRDFWQLLDQFSSLVASESRLITTTLFFVDYLKDLIFQSPLTTVTELKERITRAISEITPV